MPTFNELVKGFADKQTYERIQGLLHAGLEDVHNHAVRLSVLQSKNKAEGLVRLAFPKLTRLAGRIEDEDREKAATKPEHRDAPSKVNEGVRGVRYPYSQNPSSGFSPRPPGPAKEALYRAFSVDGSGRGEKTPRPE